MSLRHQISIRIFFISLLILLLGGAISIWQARQSVRKEVDSSIRFARQLIKISLGTNTFLQTELIARLSHLKQARHLTIQIRKPSGELVHIAHQKVDNMNNRPPNWFVNWVVGQYPQVEYPLTTSMGQSLVLIIQANPLDEIAEVWQESLTFFNLLVLLVVLTFLAVYFVFNKTLRVIQIIVEHLKGIEKGEYQKTLPHFATQEYDAIAMAINHMTDVLARTQEQNRALTQHSLAIQEEERQRLSQELHDEFGQSLTGIKVMAVTATHKTADINQITHAIIEICDHLMVVVRSMMKQLHPLVLTELGLKATVEDLLHQWETRNTSTLFSLDCDEEVEQLDHTVAIQVFRVIQESLTNIMRHAVAKQVHVRLQFSQQPARLLLSICDDGVGCNLKQQAGGFGLLGMEERIKLLGGKFIIQSQINQGMQLYAEIPLS